MHFFVELVKIAQNSPKNRIVSGAKEEADRHPMSGKRRKRLTGATTNENNTRSVPTH